MCTKCNRPSSSFSFWCVYIGCTCVWGLLSCQGPVLVFFLDCWQLQVMPITPRAGQGAPGITGMHCLLGRFWGLSQLLSHLPVFLEELSNPMIVITTSLLGSLSKTLRKTLLFRDFKCLLYFTEIGYPYCPDWPENFRVQEICLPGACHVAGTKVCYHTQDDDVILFQLLQTWCFLILVPWLTPSATFVFTAFTQWIAAICYWD